MGGAPRLAAPLAALWTSACLLGCGGGVPLLYPARTLGAGDVRVSGGTSANVLVGSFSSDVAAAHAHAVAVPLGAPPPAADPTYAKGALILAAVAPGLAPYTSARVGLGARLEGGATYTGREAHFDVRRSFDWRDVSLSVGIGVETPVYGDSDDGTLPQIDLSAVHGYGVDVPVLVGWQSAVRAYMVWAGARVGWDHVGVSSVSSRSGAPIDGNGDADDAATTAWSLAADRLYAGGVVGIAGGFRHVHAALELDVAYQSVRGTFLASSVSAGGVSLAPAGAIWWTF